MESRDPRPRPGGPRRERPDPADSEEIRRRIENLRLALLGRAGDVGGEARDAGAGGTAEAKCHGGDAEPGSTGVDAPFIIEAIEGAREVTSGLGRCLVIEKRLRECPGLDRLDRAHRSLAGREDVSGEAPAEAARSRLAFLDLETTGLSATPLFLAGLLVERGGTLEAVQLLARDYSEERCLIGELDRLLGGSEVCVTFNGKSFDLPYLRERAKYHRLPLEARPEQLDLLHHARRRWKASLPDCRLLTLEWYILGRRRMGDVGGWEVPCIYHEFVHTKDATRLRDVLRHNLLDVLAMAELLISLAEA